jgi:hypothetical protein
LPGIKRRSERNDSCRSNGSTATKKSSTHDKFSATPSISWATILNREFDLSPISLFDTNVAPAKVYFGAPMTTYGSPVYEAAIAFHRRKLLRPLAGSQQHLIGLKTSRAMQVNATALSSCYWPEIAFRWGAFVKPLGWRLAPVCAA